ncbi:MAG: hypothetical protein LC796_05930 [Acidobacteria bacterium]|nr:hypothetical protein [Acidobacteriota bacterium]MCA1611740.1 hypothetical protein [Acidobacteriota bacterium]
MNSSSCQSGRARRSQNRAAAAAPAIARTRIAAPGDLGSFGLSSSILYANSIT